VASIRTVCGAFLILIAAWLPATADGGGEIAWGTKVRGALNEAAQSSRPILVDVWAVWCVPCKEMARTTFRDPGFVEAIGEFVPLKVDFDVQEIFVERYRVEAMPTLLFLDGDGQEITRQTGLIATADLLETMRVVSEGYTGYREAVARPKEPEALEAVAAYLLDAGNPGESAALLRKAIKASKGESRPRRETLELRLAKCQLAAEEWRAATTTFERLSTEAEDTQVRGQALQGLVRAHRGRERDEQAAQAMTRLAEEFPELADELADADR